MTSVAYTRILFERFWKRSVEFVSHPPDLESMLSVADAAMLIGDPALLALEQADSRRRDTGEELLYFDLAHEWRVRTGLPWISAFWAVRSQAFEESRFPGEQLVLDLKSSRDRGLAHVNSLAAEWSLRIGLAPAVIEAYLTENIHYVFDEECRRGLELFYRYAEEGGILPPVSGLKFV
jgi:chorismate dehydratase